MIRFEGVHKWFGTVRDDGVDIDPDARDAGFFGFLLRSYGASAVPPEEMIVAALTETR